MDYKYSNYYYYSNIDHNCESLGECRAGALGIAAYYFASMKKLSTEEFLKIYSIGVKNESK